jgi:hypothetical protein
MTGHVISHRGPRRKRRRAQALAARRLLALAVTMAALITTSWLAPYFCAAPPIGQTPQRQQVEAVRATKIPVAIKLAAKAEPAPVMQAQRARSGRRPVPLDARGNAHDEGFEVLTAPELAAISQARNETP